MRAHHLLTACLVLGACSTSPAYAGPAETAAWATAGSICNALSLGLSFKDATDWGLRQNASLWREQILDDPLFSRLTSRELYRQCPQQMQRIDAASPLPGI